jgi:hypothetical protein
MRPKKFDDIPDIDTLWEDYSGQCVEKFIKQELLKRCGWLFRSLATMYDCSYLYGFTDFEQYEKWHDGEDVTPLFKIALPGGDVFEHGFTGVNISVSSESIVYGNDLNLSVSYTNTVVRNTITDDTTVTYHDTFVLIRRALGTNPNQKYYEVARVNYQDIDGSTYNMKDLIDPNYSVQKFKVSLIDRVTGAESAISTFTINVTPSFIIDNVTSYLYPLTNGSTIDVLVRGTNVNRTLNIEIWRSSDITSLTYQLGHGDYSVNPYQAELNLEDMPTGTIYVRTWVTATYEGVEYTSNEQTKSYYYENPNDERKYRTLWLFNTYYNPSNPKVYDNNSDVNVMDFVIYNGVEDQVTVSSNYTADIYTMTFNDCQPNVIYHVTPHISIDFEEGQEYQSIGHYIINYGGIRGEGNLSIRILNN